ncbi:MAG: pyridoxine 5'-phosphate synthase [Lysobacterales bacterium]
MMIQSVATPKRCRTALSVNLNKVALLRNSRGGRLPDPLEAARTAMAAGADGITLHPRPDLRHARPADAEAMRGLCTSAGVELNLEGNPFAGPAPGYPGFMALLESCRPEQATLVPDSDQQLTSDHGWNLQADGDRLRPLISRLKSLGMRVSLFMDADSADIERVAEIGADRIELYTGPYAQAAASGHAAATLSACLAAAQRALACGLAVNAGHDLDQGNLGALLAAVPYISEVSIGHALIAEALDSGLGLTVSRYMAIIRAANGS